MTMRTKHNLLVAGCLATVLVLVCRMPDAEAVSREEFSPASSLKNFTRINREISGLDFDGLTERTEVIREIQKNGQECIDAVQLSLERLQRSLNVIGGAGAAGSGMEAQLGALKKEKARLEEKLEECRYIVVRADDILFSIGERRRSLRSTELLHRRPVAAALVRELSVHGGRWLRQVDHRALPAEVFSCLGSRWYVVGAILLVALMIGLAAGRAVNRQLVLLQGRSDGKASSRAVGLTGLVSVPVASVQLGIALPILLFCRETGFSSDLANIFFALALLLSLQPLAPCLWLSWKDRTELKRVRGSCRLLLNAASATLILFLFPFGRIVPEPFLDAGRLAAMLVTFGGAVLLVIRGRSLVNGSAGRIISAVFLAGLLTTSILCLAGYYDLAGYVYMAGFGSFAAWLLTRWLGRLTDLLVGGIAAGGSEWSTTWRQRFGIRQHEVVTSLVWLKLLLKMCGWIAFACIVIWLWDLSHTFLSQIYSVFRNGFAIGAFSFKPIKIFFGLVVFGALWTLFSWLARKVGRELQEGRLNRAAQDTAVTLFTYSGFGIALFISLGVAGMDFSNLAIIAGALSVGIGFGLQNIVNNFVSGLILLFEHPIKRGDWIVVGDIEGYVKKISVRSTLIRTFDNADVIVPNSELIAGKVVNWMLSDKIGRVIVPVGVAYGSDTEKVKGLLLEAAANHPLVLSGDATLSTQGFSSAPYVLFKEFGSSSLNFELRCFIKDIDSRLRTVSELNFAIDDAFRRNNIVIPFPQQDVYLKSVPEGKTVGVQSTGSEGTGQ